MIIGEGQWGAIQLVLPAALGPSTTTIILAGPAGLETDAEPVACRVSQIKLGAELALGSLDRLVAERRLDLFERRLTGAGGPGEGAPQVVRRQVPAELARVRADHV